MFHDGYHRYPEEKAQVVGPLAAMNDDALRPDVVLIVCKPHQGQHILRAYGFDSGELVLGIAVRNLPRICRTSSMHKFTLFHER